MIHFYFPGISFIEIFFCYLAVGSSDHVNVVADQFECKASVHQGKAALQRHKDWSQTGDQTKHHLIKQKETHHLAQMEESMDNKLYLQTVYTVCIDPTKSKML